MNNEIYLFGEVGHEITLENLVNQVKQTDPEQPLVVNIHSQGGSVFEGLAIYNYLKGLKQEVQTVSGGLVASIASVIFLAGSKRTINSTTNFLIHLPSAGNWGNAEDLERTAKELRKIENTLADIYVKETALTQEEAMDLMSKDEFLNVSLLQEKGFVSEVLEFQAVAKYDEYKPKSNNMTEETNKEVKGMFGEIKEMLNRFFKPVNKLVQDADGNEIEFPTVDEQDAPEVGDEAKVNNAPIEDGERTMPNGETWVFTDGKLSEIKPQEEEPPAEPTEEEQAIENLNQEIENLKEQLTAKSNELEQAKNDSANKLEEIQAKLTQIENALGSDFNYEDKQKTKEENKSRTFKFN